MLLSFILHIMRVEMDKATTLAIKNQQYVAYPAVEICGA